MCLKKQLVCQAPKEKILQHVNSQKISYRLLLVTSHTPVHFLMAAALSFEVQHEVHKIIHYLHNACLRICSHKMNAVLMQDMLNFKAKCHCHKDLNRTSEATCTWKTDFSHNRLSMEFVEQGSCILCKTFVLCLILLPSSHLFEVHIWPKTFELVHTVLTPPIVNLSIFILQLHDLVFSGCLYLSENSISFLYIDDSMPFVWTHLYCNQIKKFID